MQKTFFQKGSFNLASGKRSRFKIECEALTASDWAGLVEFALERKLIPLFSEVLPVPRGGIPFAAAISKFASHLRSDKARPLIVDDVLTSGGSILSLMAQTGNLNPPANVLVAFDRTGVLREGKAWLENARAIWSV